MSVLTYSKIEYKTPSEDRRLNRQLSDGVFLFNNIPGVSSHAFSFSAYLSYALLPRLLPR